MGGTTGLRHGGSTINSSSHSSPLVDPMIYRWIADWLSDRSIELTIDGIQSPRQESRCGIPQGSPLSPVLFGLVCATALKGLPPGASYVDDCSWAIPFISPRQLQREAGQLLGTVNDRFKQHGLSLDIGKLEIAFISKNKPTSKRYRDESKKWKVTWGGKVLANQGTTRWLGFHLDPFLNWRAHVRIRVQQGLYRQHTVARFMQRWGIKRQLARMVAWSTSMATAAYGIEAICQWEGQPWVVQAFHKLAAQICRDMAGTFRTTMKDGAIREAGTPPTRAALDRRTEPQFVRMVSNSPDHPCQAYFEEWELSEGETAPLGSWLRRSSEGLWHRGQPVEQTTPLPVRLRTGLKLPKISRKEIRFTCTYIRMVHVENPPVMVGL
jgi:hypothetical protein